VKLFKVSKSLDPLVDFIFADRESRGIANDRLALAFRRPGVDIVHQSLLPALFLSCSLFLFVSLAAAPVWAQSNYAAVSGTVFDPQQKAIPGASVQLTSQGTQATRQVTSNDQGLFQMTGLLPGEYKLVVEAAGFALLNQNLRLELASR